MSATVNFLRSSTSGVAPSTAQLGLGQIAVNMADGKLFVRKGTGLAGDAIIEVSADKVLKSGDTMTGALTVNSTITATGQIFANSNVIVGTNAGGGNNLYLNGASGTMRGIGFQTAGAYAGDISLQTNNTTLAYKSVGIHSFQISGTETLQVNGTGVAVTGTLTVGGKTVAGIAADGGMEVGNYIDFHSPTADGADYKARIQADGSGSIFIDPTSDVMNVWATQVYIGGGTQNLMLQHDGTNGFIRTVAGKGGLYLGAGGTSTFTLGTAGNATLLVNGAALNFTDVSGSNPRFTCQTDNNFVFYGTNSTGAARPIFGIFMRSDTAALGINVDVTAASGILNVRGTTMMQLTHDGSNGYIQAKTGMLVLGANGVNSIWINTDGTVTSGQQWTFTNTINYTAGGNQMVLKNGTASNPSMILRNDGTNFYFLKSAASTAPNGAWDATRPLTINMTSGDVTMSQNLTVSGNSYASNFQTTGSNGAVVVNTRDSGANWTVYNSGGIFRLWNGADQFTVDPNGNIWGRDHYADRRDGTGVIYFGNPANSHYLYWDQSWYHFNNGAVHVNGQIQVDSFATFVVGASFGAAVTMSSTLNVAGNITYTSDARKKSDIRVLDDSSPVLGISAHRFVKDGREEIGFIAQEVEEHIPEAVHTDDDGWKSLNDVPILAMLLEQVKALTARVHELEAVVQP